MIDMRKPLIVYLIGYLTFSLAHYPPGPLHRTPFLPSFIHPNPYLHGGIHFRRPFFNMNQRFHAGLRFPLIPRSNTMFIPHPRSNSHGNCASEKLSVRPSIPAEPSSYDRKDLLTSESVVQKSEFESKSPTIESQSIHVRHNIGKIPSGSNLLTVPEANQDENTARNHPTINSGPRQSILEVKPTLRLESTNSSNETSSDQRFPDWNYFDFITNKDFIIKLIENKLIKLQNQEKIVGGISVNTQLYDQIKKIEDAMGITVSVDNATTPSPPASPSSTGESGYGNNKR